MESTRAVHPVHPVAPYLGGKRNLAKRLIGRIDAIPHDTHAEPFIGMGGAAELIISNRRTGRVEP